MKVAIIKADLVRAKEKGMYYYFSNTDFYFSALNNSGAIRAATGAALQFVLVDTPNDIYNTWSALGTINGNTYHVNTAIINLHGCPAYMLSSDGQTIIASNFAQKDVDTIVLLSCETGQLIAGNNGNNVAQQFVLGQNTNLVIAPERSALGTVVPGRELSKYYSKPSNGYNTAYLSYTKGMNGNLLYPLTNFVQEKTIIDILNL